MDWQPIETAPADSETIVLLWFEGARHPVFGITYRYHDGTVGVSSDARGFKFTHWMPLPPPPVTSEEG